MRTRKRKAQGKDVDEDGEGTLAGAQTGKDEADDEKGPGGLQGYPTGQRGGCVGCEESIDVQRGMGEVLGEGGAGKQCDGGSEDAGGLERTRGTSGPPEKKAEAACADQQSGIDLHDIPAMGQKIAEGRDDPGEEGDCCDGKGDEEKGRVQST